MAHMATPLEHPDTPGNTAVKPAGSRGRGVVKISDVRLHGVKMTPTLPSRASGGTPR